MSPDMSNKQDQRLRDALDAAAADGGVPSVWTAIDAWLPTVAPDVAAHLGRECEQRLRVRRLSLAAQRIAGVVDPRPRKRRGKGA